ncbi:hypothetical protein GGR43_001783 [Sphingobium jiangsuense]|uniref:Uncharacterized protein n=1 Tax=Sphingobium jiangsuense TaxID=870476 RepID=A0A7W6FPN6_9SPHN|nr:hypothetical protein [Sphingobium jiangsuense]MBB3926068.1 hypothetical protein [Sphingobium jiangsuense]
MSFLDIGFSVIGKKVGPATALPFTAPLRKGDKLRRGPIDSLARMTYLS